MEGTMLDEANVRRVLYRIVEKAGLRRIRFHDLRHTFASQLIQHGESLAYVRDQGGHRSIQVTVDLQPPRNPRTKSSGRKRCKSFRANGEPKFRELEPAGPVAAPG
jgi:integrase